MTADDAKTAVGGDPFGQDFVELAAEFQAAGRPYRGVADPRP